MQQNSQRRVEGVRLPHKRVLVADDDPELRQVIRQILESAGIEVQEASSGVELLSRLAKGGSFDLVVTDVQMPWASGEQVMQAARTAGYAMPVVLMTAFADDRLRRTVAAIPGAMLIEKPFDVRRLVEVVRSVLSPG